MLFCCKSANDSQEVNKTWLVLLGRVKTMKKGNYLSIFSKQTSASCFQALTIENIALIAAILRHFLSRRAWSPGRWLGMANFKINSHLCRLLTILLPQCQFKSISSSCLFVTLKRTQRKKDGGRSLVIWSFFRLLTLRRASWGVAYNTHQRSEDLRKLKNVPKISSTLEGWAPRVDDCLQQRTNWQGGRFLNESSRLYLLSLGKGLVFSSG